MLVLLSGALDVGCEVEFTLEQAIFGLALLGALSVDSLRSIAPPLLRLSCVKCVARKITKCLAHAVLLNKLKNTGA